MIEKKGLDRKTLLVVIGVSVVAAVILLRFGTGGNSINNAGGERSALQATEEGKRSSGRIGTLSTGAEPEKESRPRTPAARSPLASPAPSPTPEYQPVESKRGYYSDNFEASTVALEKYKLDNLVLTSEGITFPPASKAAEGEEGEIRKGVIESSPIALEFPSNFLMPLWRQKLPEGSAITIELAISPDGQEWSRWFPLEPNDDEISPTYPDGTPNPNYGFIGGTGISNGTRLYPSAKYRVTLVSTDAHSSPVFHEIKLYHVDSTGPDGVLAERAYSTPEQQ